MSLWAEARQAGNHLQCHKTQTKTTSFNFMYSINVFDLLIHDLIKPRKFNCVTAVSREFHLPFRGEPRIFPNSQRNFSNFSAENCGPYSMHHQGWENLRFFKKTFRFIDFLDFLAS